MTQSHGAMEWNKTEATGPIDKPNDHCNTAHTTLAARDLSYFPIPDFLFKSQKNYTDSF